MTWWDAAFLAAAGVVGGLTGSIAGLASIATYPALLVVGLPPVTANVTNTVAMVFNAIGSVLGSRPELKGQGPWLKRILPVAAVARRDRCGAAAVHTGGGLREDRADPARRRLARHRHPPSRQRGCEGGKPPAAHRHDSARVGGDLRDLYLRRLFRRRGGRVVDRAAAPCRPCHAGARQRLQERDRWRREHRCGPDIFVRRPGALARRLRARARLPGRVQVGPRRGTARACQAR